MRDPVITAAIIQISLLMVLSSFFISWWTYFLIAFEAISIFQLTGYYLFLFINGMNLCIICPISLYILRSEGSNKWCRRIILTLSVLMCILSVLPPILLSNVLSNFIGKGEMTKRYLNRFYLSHGRLPYLMDDIQKMHHCCGHTSYKDYLRNPTSKLSKEPLPLSCCTEIVPACERAESFVFKQGCFVDPGKSNNIIAFDHPFHGTGFLPAILIPLALPLALFIQTCFFHDALVRIRIKKWLRKHDPVPPPPPTDGNDTIGGVIISTPSTLSSRIFPTVREDTNLRTCFVVPKCLRRIFCISAKESKTSTTFSDENSSNYSGSENDSYQQSHKDDYDYSEYSHHPHQEHHHSHHITEEHHHSHPHEGYHEGHFEGGHEHGHHEGGHHEGSHHPHDTGYMHHHDEGGHLHHHEESGHRQQHHFEHHHENAEHHHGHHNENFSHHHENAEHHYGHHDDNLSHHHEHHEHYENADNHSHKPHHHEHKGED